MKALGRLHLRLARQRVPLDDIRSRLWNDDVDPLSYVDGGDKYQAAIMEQYKLYVEMADRVAARRTTANTFFLLANSGTITALASLGRASTSLGQAVLVLAIVVLLLQCSAWYWTLRSYRQLSSIKFRVIGVLEERLPASLWLRAEWEAVGSGGNRAVYWPVARLEQCVPTLFASAYVAFLVIIVAD
ncbi:hypothetical protein [Micromonospora zamorensis]|uniref:RipA family octameric membrane protein n=1 Tax=Micromonospora zamorensis TaxID=709883 RepID=UPI002ED5CD54|nr:hypothetical protein OG886_07195 [Micromonospora zamorensis]